MVEIHAGLTGGPGSRDGCLGTFVLGSDSRLDFRHRWRRGHGVACAAIYGAQKPLPSHWAFNVVYVHALFECRGGGAGHTRPHPDTPRRVSHHLASEFLQWAALIDDSGPSDGHSAGRVERKAICVTPAGDGSNCTAAARGAGVLCRLLVKRWPWVPPADDSAPLAGAALVGSSVWGSETAFDLWIVCVVTFAASKYGMGPFRDLPPDGRTYGLQLHLLAMSLPMLFSAAAIAERRSCPGSHADSRASFPRLH